MPQWLVAPAKLTVSLSVVARRPDGFHDIEAEMVSLDLHDRLLIDAAGKGLAVVPGAGSRAESLPSGSDAGNIVTRALRAVDRTAMVTLHKRIPVGGGLGGGSADAGAILRWAGVDDPAVAARLGADVPFCVRGGRARVEGIGERLTPLPFESRAFVLLVPPFAVDTAAAYRAWDRLAGATGAEAPPWRGGAGPGAGAGRVRGFDPAGLNGLTAAALSVEPRLARWGELLGELTGIDPVLAGSGSTWWVDGVYDELPDTVTLGREEGRLIPVRTVPEGWSGA